jgi:antitoxin (DNA-binding transcriptional repressor) of toxin-antitoxin stability system
MPFPRLVEIEQRLYSRRIADIPKAVHEACASAGLADRVKPGHRVAVTVGSRGVAKIADIARAVVAEVKGMGARPFILPAMGSHGGATPAGQTAVLASLGVTPDYVGAPIRASMAVERLGKTRGGVEVFVSREGLKADAIIVMNRIKQHTDFEGEYESGLVKMIAVGMGKRHGAAAMHGRRCASLREDVPEAARMVLARAPVAVGLGILENGYNEPAEIMGLRPEAILEREPELMRRVRRNAARLPFRDIDLLIVDWIGKDISGIGMDTHVICRRMIWEEPEFRGTNIQLIAALDLTEGSHGNALGVGLADLITDRLLGKIDMQALKTNVLHTGWLNRAKIPLSFANDREVLEAAFVGLGDPDPRKVRIVRIQDTLHLGRMWISEGLVAEARRKPRVRVLGKLSEIGFDGRGNFR